MVPLPLFAGRVKWGIEAPILSCPGFKVLVIAYMVCCAHKHKSRMAAVLAGRERLIFNASNFMRRRVRTVGDIIDARKWHFVAGLKFFSHIIPINCCFKRDGTRRPAVSQMSEVNSAVSGKCS